MGTELWPCGYSGASLNLGEAETEALSTSFTVRTAVSKLTCLNLCEGGHHPKVTLGRENGATKGFWIPIQGPQVDQTA
jgi:hypothetical protein